MSLGKNLQKVIQKLFKQIFQLSRAITKGLMNWLLRNFLVLGRKSQLAKAGFVLPTVVMVILVVTLLTTAILFRSFDRSRNASNVRVNEAVMQAATPAIDRAKTKIARLFAGPPKLSATPADVDLYTAIASSADNLSRYTFGDETPLKIVNDFGDGSGKYTGGNNTIEKLGASPGQGATTIEGDETLTTAWRFPVDTNNDGFFDSYSLYAIYYRSPTSGTRNQRVPLEARNPPMEDNSNISNCNLGSGTSASLATAQGWYKLSSGSLKRSFFVYTALVPITDTTGLDSTKYRQYTGNKGFSALEYQQDQARLAANNNAVLYDDDLEITPGSGINLNGRVMTNSNLITRKGNNDVRYYLVSSKLSCFYSDEENSRISVGGNVVLGSVSGGTTNAVTVDLFPGANQAPTNGTGNLGSGTVSDSAPNVAYNSQAYNDRIDKIVGDWISVNPDSNYKTSDPKEVIDNITSILPASASAQKLADTRRKELEAYFKNRMRRVPAKEVQPGATDPSVSSVATTGVANPTGDPSLRPTDLFHYPFDPNNNSTSNNKLALLLDQLPAVEPTTEKAQGETKLGDRILVGNGLPAEWWNTAASTPSFADATQNIQNQQIKPTTPWLSPSDPSKKNRYRTTQFVPLSDLGDTSRGGFWEVNAAAPPVQPFDGFGGLRVVTGAGVYSGIRESSDFPAIANQPKGSFLPYPHSSPNNNSPDPTKPTFDDPSTTAVEQYPIVWPDTMPQWEDANRDGTVQPPAVNGNPSPIATSDRRGDLVMRATAVYHYAASSYDSQNTPKQYQAPIACVSSYYDPSTSNTAINQKGLPDIRLRSGTSPNRTLTGLTTIANGGGNSWNGVSYKPPTITASGVGGISGPGANGLFSPVTGGEDPTTGSLSARLAYQANLVFPNGRFVNEELRNALTTLASNGTLTLDQQAAIDSTICALSIADGTIGAPSDQVIPHGAIYETTFLDARQLKAIDADSTDTTKKAGAAAFTALDINNATPANRNKSILTGNYDLSIEERQPLEIRATVLDLDLLRQTKVTINQLPNHTYPSPEYLLPDSGIIYATRDDGLLDLSDSGLSNIATLTDQQKSTAQREIKSPVDFNLDPTRRPNGILLINGNILARGDKNDSKYNHYDLISPPGTEKGLTLVSNLPAYVQADAVDHGFNIHKNPQTNKVVEEFAEQLSTNPSWTPDYFYNKRQTPEYQFACRAQDPRLPKCTEGDLWRSTTVLADSVTLLSDGFRFGFRNEGDYDLRNNNGDPSSITNRKLNGFYNNNFVTNGLSSSGSFAISNGSVVTPVTPPPVDKDYVQATPNALSSSYFNNFVTPIQRRVQFPEYIMEICRKLPVSECSASDWVVGLDINGNNSLDDPIVNFDVNNNGIVNNPTATPPSVDPGDVERNIKANQLGYALTTQNLINGSITALKNIPSISRVTTSLGGVKTDRDLLGAGTTAKPPLLASDQRYARRVAFARNQFDELALTATGTPSGTNHTAQPLGISSGTPSCNNLVKVNVTAGLITGGAYNSSGCSYPDGIPVTAANYGSPDPNSNALWFRTTNDITGNPVLGDQNNLSDPTIAYRPDRPLYYRPPFDATELLLLPNVAFSPTVADISNNVNSINGVISALNGGSGPYPLNATLPYSPSRPSTNRPLSAFAAYFLPPTSTPPQCSNPTLPAQVALSSCSTTNYNISSSAQTDITNAISGLNNLTGGLTWPPTATQPNPGSNDPATITINASTSTNLNVYKLPSNATPNNINNNAINSNGTTITLNGNRDSVFVFQVGSVAPTFNGVTLLLNGVDPNNVFWGFYDKGFAFSSTNKLAGNFLGSGTITSGGTTPSLAVAGRLLGFANTAIPTGLTLYPMTSQNQPLLAPVLQLHLTTAQDPTNPATGKPTNTTPSTSSQVENTLWLAKASKAPNASNNDPTFNLVAAGGDTPNRPGFQTVGEFNGGLHNFVRFLENWRNKNNYINGSFIQFKRSAYATAPFQPNFNGGTVTNTPTSLTGGILGYPQLSPTGVGPVGGSAFGRENYYVEPIRNWGFDVGQLSQYPDLFSQRFTTPPAGDPNQFYREVGKDDPWVQALLCAGVGQGSPQAGFTYGSAYASTNTTTPPSGITCPALSKY